MVDYHGNVFRMVGDDLEEVTDLDFRAKIQWEGFIIDEKDAMGHARFGKYTRNHLDEIQ